jgi:hypothetical protein
MKIIDFFLHYDSILNLLKEGSQMPSQRSFDVHEWINEILTVPNDHLTNPQPRERAWQNQRGKKTLLSFEEE